jgi:hypothetical protein
MPSPRNGGYLRVCSNILGHAPLPLPSSGPPGPATWIPPAGRWPGCPGPGWLHRGPGRPRRRRGREDTGSRRNAGAMALPRPSLPRPSASRPGAYRRSSAAGSPLPTPRPLHRGTRRPARPGRQLWRPHLHRGHHRSSLTAHRAPKACHSRLRPLVRRSARDLLPQSEHRRTVRVPPRTRPPAQEPAVRPSGPQRAHRPTACAGIGPSARSVIRGAGARSTSLTRPPRSGLSSSCARAAPTSTSPGRWF